jgi:uncharacterized protein YerC
MQKLDWPAMLYQLMQKEITQDHISKYTGISTTTISHVKLEKKLPSEEWDKAMLLLDLYLKTMDKPPPRILEGFQY